MTGTIQSELGRGNRLLLENCTAEATSKRHRHLTVTKTACFLPLYLCSWLLEPNADGPGAAAGGRETGPELRSFRGHKRINRPEEDNDPMKFDDTLVNDTVVLDVSGKIMGGEETTLFHGKLHEYIALNKTNVVVDLSKVDWMNSVGLGMLISALTTVKNAGGRLVLANITKIESILTITRLITVFEHYDSREEALKSFA
jgi:anti-sigma B factor antagonist